MEVNLDINEDALIIIKLLIGVIDGVMAKENEQITDKLRIMYVRTV